MNFSLSSWLGMIVRIGMLPFLNLRSMSPGMARFMAVSMWDDSYSSCGRQSSRSREVPPDSNSSCSHSTLLLGVTLDISDSISYYTQSTNTYYMVHRGDDVLHFSRRGALDDAPPVHGASAARAKRFPLFPPLCFHQWVSWVPTGPTANGDPLSLYMYDTLS